MHILGVGGSDHDFSAVILDDGEVIAAVEDERVNRIKHGRGDWPSVPTQPAVQYCLQTAGLSLSDVDALYGNLHLEKRAFAHLPADVRCISHHLAHAACSFYPSPFDQAAVVVIDGAGNRVWADERHQDLETISIGVGRDNELNIDLLQSGRRLISTCYWRYLTADSIGAFYGLVTEALGFGPFGGGKTMGLAPYGDHSRVPQMRAFVSIEPEGRFRFEPYSGILDWLADALSSGGNAFQRHADVAAAAQQLFEEAVLNVMRHAYAVTGLKRLCYAGGCALNSVANEKICRLTPFSELFIHPAPSDNGTALGAALFAYHSVYAHPRSTPSARGLGTLVYTGKRYTDREIEAAIGHFPVYARHSTDLTDEAAWRLAQGQVLGWFQGRSEIGPRALGNRSILASSTDPRMRDYVNRRIKHRETFRPLAPAVTIEDAERYFELHQPSPFMLLAAPVRPEYRRLLHAVTHIDGTARIQTVDQPSNPRFYQLLRAYGGITGHPVLLNTSFNARSEPIVETPEDALECFLRTKLDLLVLGDYMIEKHTPWARL